MSVSNHSYSHTHHFVTVDQFNSYIEGLLNSDKLDEKKKALLHALVKSDLWHEVQRSSYWRHNIFNGGLSGPFTEYFSTFKPEWKVDFWGKRVQPIDITYLHKHAIPRAYQATVLKTQELLSEKAKNDNLTIASLACGTMYDVLAATYQEPKKMSFWGFDVDKESLQLAKEKANSLGYNSAQVILQECDISIQPLPANHFDIVLCNGFSFYIDDAALLKLVEKVKKALKQNGIFLMSFIQPTPMWKMDEEESKTNIIFHELYEALPMNWSAHLRTGDQVQALVTKGGFEKTSIVAESHNIHPLLIAQKSRAEFA